MKPFNHVESTAILACKQINSNSFKNEISYKIFTRKLYVHIHLNVCKKIIVNGIITHVGCKYLKPFNCVKKKLDQVHLETLTTKCV